ncbi:hypothetical protein Tco_1211909 [Tanacetum coccineum]
MELMEKRRKHFVALRAQEKRNKPHTKAQKKSQMSTYLKDMGGYKHKQLMGKSYDEIQKLEEKAKSGRKKSLDKKRVVKEQQQEFPKRQKLRDDKETDEHEEVEADDTAELKNHLVIKKDDDIAIDIIPLATKPLVIVDYKLLKEGIMTLWKLVKTKHGDLRPEDEHERVLWGDLKVMFEPDIRSDVWRDLQGYKIYSLGSTSSSSKSTHDYSRKHQRAILEPWRQSHNLPPSPPSPPPNKNTPTSPITTNSSPSLSPPQNPSPNQIAHELHHLSNLLKINLQQEIDATNPSPPTSPCIPSPFLDQVNFHLEFCHCCLNTRNLFDTLKNDLNRIKSLIIGPSTQFSSSITTSSP